MCIFALPRNAGAKLMDKKETEGGETEKWERRERERQRQTEKERERERHTRI